MNDLIRLLLTWMETGICSILHFQPSVSVLDKANFGSFREPSYIVGMADRPEVSWEGLRYFGLSKKLLFG